MSSEYEPRLEFAPVREALGELLANIANGKVQVRRLNSRACVHARYETTNGWKLTVFNDAGGWDYLERTEDPQGRVLDYDEIQAIEGINWSAVADHSIWGTFLRQTEFDPEYPDQDPEDRYNLFV